jgi:hypothetical protein
MGGNVGIGTSSHGATLDVSGNASGNKRRINFSTGSGHVSFVANRNAATNDAVNVYQTSGTTNWTVGLAAGTLGLSNNDYGIVDGSGNSRLYIQSSTGNVGIAQIVLSKVGSCR